MDELPGAQTINDLMSHLTALLGLQVLGILLVGWLLSTIAGVVLRRASRAWPEHSIRHLVADSLNGPLRWAILVLAFWIAGRVFIGDWGSSDDDTVRFELSLIIALELPFALWFGFRFIDRAMAIWERHAAKTEGTFDDQLVPVARAFLKVTLIIIGVVMMIQNAGGEVGSLLAGFGIGGIAVAMAAKDTLANLFGSLVIFVDRPFQVGDWVEIGEQEGTVEEVGLRVTRIRTFANSMITVPNSALTTTPINNWSRMKKRRIKLTVGLTYDTSAAKMRQAVDVIRKTLRESPHVVQDFFLVNFTDFGPSSLDVFVYCFTKTTNWSEYMDVRQELLLRFMEEIEQLGLEFAFPTQTLHLAANGSRDLDQLPGGLGQ